MKGVISILGIVLIVLGIASLGYQGITYTKREKVVQLGSLEVSADTQKTIYLSPLVGGASLVAGIFLVLIGRSGGK